MDSKPVNESSVSGRITNGAGDPVEGASVRAVDQGLVSQAILGEDTTDADGRYEIRYDAQTLLDPGRRAPNLLVQVGAEGRTSASSAVRFNARKEERIDLAVEGIGGLTEWERIETALQPTLQGARLAELSKGQLGFVQRASRLPAVLVGVRLQAAKAAQQSGLPEWFHYALLRQGMPGDIEGLHRASETLVGRALANAGTAGIIPPTSDKQATALLARLVALRVDHALEQPLAGHAIKVGELLGVAGLPPEAQRALAGALGSRTLDAESTLEALHRESVLESSALTRVRFALRAAKLSHDHLPTIAAVQRDRRVTSTLDLARHYTVEDWRTLVDKASAKDGSDLPPQAKGRDPAQRRENFARLLHARVAAEHPTTAVACGLSRHPKLADGKAAQLLPRIAEADPHFDLGTARLDAYLKDHAQALAIDKGQRAAITEELKRVQRLYRLKPDAAAIAQLLHDKVDSAAAILSMGRSRFVATYGSPERLGRDGATAIFRQAEMNAAKAFAAFARYSPAVNVLQHPAAIGGCPAELRPLPHFATLFGSLDGCECEPCESVYSPAAYLTDLLAFIKHGVERDPLHPNAARVPENGLLALDWRSFCNGEESLVSKLPRRPDIVDIQLSCRNAQTLVPYVDLVLEILEHAAAPGNATVPQTTMPAEELAARPEHLNADAYATLARTTFPFDLPFDFSHVEETIALDRLGTSRAELLETLYPFQEGSAGEFPGGDPFDLTEIRRSQDKAIAQARLGLSDARWALISGRPLATGAGAGTISWLASESWGYRAGSSWWHPLQQVDTLLDRSGLEYADLLRLLRLKSFNPDGSIAIRNDSAVGCDLAKLHISGLDESALMFLQRFLRIRSALGWTLQEVDHALGALASGTANGRPAIDEELLVRLSHVVRLQERFALPVDVLLGWWAPLDTRDRTVPSLAREAATRSLYERLCLSQARTESERALFQLSQDRSELRNPGLPMLDVLPAIGAALKLEQSDLRLLIAGTISAASPPLNLVNLSVLHRHASIAKALQLKITDYLTARALIAFDPFTAAPLSATETLDATVQTLRFIERADLLRRSPFSSTELDYVLRQTMPFADPTSAPTEAWVEQGLAALESGLKLADPFAEIRSRLSQASALLGAGPATTASADDLLSLLSESLSLIPALAMGAQTDPLAAALEDAVGVLTAGAAVHFSRTRTKIGAATDLLNGLTDAFVEGALRPQLSIDLANVLGTTPAMCAELLAQLPLPMDPTVRAGDALLSALAPGALSASGTGSAVPRAGLVELLRSLHKAVRVIAPLGIDQDALPELLARSPAAGWLDLTKLPIRSGDAPASFDSWARLVRLIRFRDALAQPQRRHLFSIFDSVDGFQPGLAPNAGPARRAARDALAVLAGWDAADVDALVGRWDFGEVSHGAGGILKPRFPAHFADERLACRVGAAVRMLRRLGTSADAAAGWISGGPVQARARAERINDALRSRSGDGWVAVLKPLRDQLREQQRKALVSHLTHTLKLSRPDDLFDHFLIDVEMSPCMMTSRLIQATASVQLFVQRVLMNLEPGLAMSDDAAEQWEWMKNYRVWEANRKIFLYPENWIEPELRDDKTPFFEDLEREIMQSDITNESAESALRHYLEKLDEVSRLQVCGQYLESGNPATLHVFARTRDVPHHYYYRRGILAVDVEELKGSTAVTQGFDAHWTPWERIDVDIEGDHLIPVVYNRRVYLFWPIFTEKDDPAFSQLEKQIIDVLRFGFQLQQLLAKLQSEVGLLVLAVGEAILSGTAGALQDGLNAVIDGLNTLRTGLASFNRRFDQVSQAASASADSASSTARTALGAIPAIGGGLDLIYGMVEDLVKSVETAGSVTFGAAAAPFNTPVGRVSLTAGLPQGDPAAHFQAIEATIGEIGSLVEGFLTDQFITLVPARRLEVQLAWAERRHDGWSSKKTSAGLVSFRDILAPLLELAPSIPGAGKPTTRRFFGFTASVEPTSDDLLLHCNISLPEDLSKAGSTCGAVGGRPLMAPKRIGLFRLGGCNGRMAAVDVPEHFGISDLLSWLIADLATGIESQLTGFLDTLQGIPGLQPGEPSTPDDDPRRPSEFRCFLESQPLPRRRRPHVSLLTQQTIQVEDVYRVLARHQETTVFMKQFGFFYQDASRSFLCFPWILPPDNPGKRTQWSGFLFFPFYHPYTCAFRANIQRAGIPAIYDERYVMTAGGAAVPSNAADAAPLQLALRNDGYFSPPEYDPVGNVYNPPSGPRALRPIEEVSFSAIGAYAQYNWELFFHIPLLIASRLATNQRFREAQRWFHYIFNPTDASRGSVPAKYWRTRPFVETKPDQYAAQDVDALLHHLDSEAAQEGRQELEWDVNRWCNDAFNPHLVARTRTVAFQKTVVMKYIDNLVAWGDSLYRRETRESVAEAMQLYILADKLLGPRPRRIPKPAARNERSFRQLEPKLDDFSNALSGFENFFPGNGGMLGTGAISQARARAADSQGLDAATLAPVDRSWRSLLTSPSLQNIARKKGTAKDLYFCVPPNDKLLAKWDLVADRLYKIRHCMNIEGGAMQLPLLSPPIDPAALVRATALGVDIDSVLGQQYAPLSNYRFQVMLQKATDLCSELKSLGGALLAALEKRDGEALAMLRCTQELRVLEAVRSIKEQQIAEAQHALEGLRRSQEATALRQAHYQRNLAEFMNPEEIAHVVLNIVSLQLQGAQFGAKFGSAMASLIPNIKGGFVTTLGATFGGDNVGFAAERAADAFGHLSSMAGAVGGLISTMGGHRRRADEWLLQLGIASKEHDGLDRQIAAAEIRTAVAQAELENHRMQMENNREVQEFMHQKFTNQELFDWMVSEVSSLHFQTYQMAHELARQCESTFATELGVASPGIVQAGYWDSLKKGLLVGEHLHHDLKRLDVAYLGLNDREYELTKHVSLGQLSPLAILELRMTGRCTVALPEALFDMDGPGHYFRRIKSVALSIPCVAGPFTSVNCTLTLLRSGIRRSPELPNGPFVPQEATDERFESIVTSSGQNDSGLLETNLRDERYLPFENAGVISEWQLSLPANPSEGEARQFDYDTISDVIMHVRYTAREGGGLLRRAATGHLKGLIEGAAATGMVRLFSARHDFPTEWARFRAQAPAAGQRLELSFKLRAEHYPYWSQGRLAKVLNIELLAKRTDATAGTGLDVFAAPSDQPNASPKDSLIPDQPIPGLVGLPSHAVTGIPIPAAPIGDFKLFFDDREFSDLWFAVTWSDA